MVGGYNNNKQFRVQHNLNAIFTQNYTNYKAIIIDDASTDGTIELYKKYFMHHKIDKKYYTLISNTKQITGMPNYFFGILNHCSKDSIVIMNDADD